MLFTSHMLPMKKKENIPDGILSQETLVEPLRVSAVQQVAMELAHYIALDYKRASVSPRPQDIGGKNPSPLPSPRWTEFCSLAKGKTTSQLKADVVFQILNYIFSDGMV